MFISGLPSKKDFLKSPLVMANDFPKIIVFKSGLSIPQLTVRRVRKICLQKKYNFQQTSSFQKIKNC